MLGQNIVIYTDHQNLIHNSFTSDRVMRWRLYLEEYSPQIKYIKGEENAAADAISRLPKMMNQLEVINVPDIKEFLTVEEMSDLFYYDQLKEKEQITTPINYKEIEKHQRLDEILKQMLQTPHTELEMQNFHGGGKTFKLIIKKTKTGRRKICIPKTLQKRTIEWFHEMLCHPG